jgi:hypothetical protein
MSDFLRVSAASWRFSPVERQAPPDVSEPRPSARYLYDEDYKRTVAALAENADLIIAHAIRGTPSRVIAAIFGVSREAIDRRLRPIGLKNPPGVRGRPWPSRFVSSSATSQSTRLGSGLVSR